MTALDRAYGALLGLAIGDALGMPTQYTPRSLILERFGVLGGFAPGPRDNPISRDMPAGRVTDDTDQAVILGEMLVAGRGYVDPNAFARALLAWERRMIASGSQDLLGPSTRKALALVAEGASTETAGRSGSTNGAAMRVAPVGIAFAAKPLDALVDAVFQSAHVTHNTTVAIAGASAVAAAVSAGVAGAPREATISRAPMSLRGAAGRSISCEASAMRKRSTLSTRWSAQASPPMKPFPRRLRFAASRRKSRGAFVGLRRALGAIAIRSRLLLARSWEPVAEPRPFLRRLCCR
jgi:ADP-ribosylglycohydrolase